MKEKDFFNSVASRWDLIAIHDPEKLRHIAGLSGIAGGDFILDVGTGTGVLLPWLLSSLGDSGRLFALDIAEQMIAEASKKNQAGNLTFINGDYLEYHPDRSFDVIYAYSCFPHFGDPRRFLEHSRLLLTPGCGRLVIAHSESRSRINACHTDISGGLSSLELPPVGVLARLASKIGFDILGSRDDNDYYYICLGRKS